MDCCCNRSQNSDQFQQQSPFNKKKLRNSKQQSRLKFSFRTQKHSKRSPLTSQIQQTQYKQNKSNTLQSTTLFSNKQLLQLQRQKQLLIQQQRKLNMFYQNDILALERQVRFYENQVKNRSREVNQLEILLENRMKQRNEIITQPGFNHNSNHIYNRYDHNSNYTLSYPNHLNNYVNNYVNNHINQQYQPYQPYQPYNPYQNNNNQTIRPRPIQKI